jgi:hypothetical protein
MFSCDFISNEELAEVKVEPIILLVTFQALVGYLFACAHHINVPLGQQGVDDSKNPSTQQ